MSSSAPFIIIRMVLLGSIYYLAAFKNSKMVRKKNKKQLALFIFFLLDFSCAGSFFNNIKPVAKNFGVWFDSNVSFEHHTTKLRSVLTDTILYAFVSSRLDSCNSSFYLPEPKIYELTPDCTEISCEAFH